MRHFSNIRDLATDWPQSERLPSNLYDVGRPIVDIIHILQQHTSYDRYSESAQDLARELASKILEAQSLIDLDWLSEHTWKLYLAQKYDPVISEIMFIYKHRFGGNQISSVISHIRDNAQSLSCRFHPEARMIWSLYYYSLGLYNLLCIEHPPCEYTHNKKYIGAAQSFFNVATTLHKEPSEELEGALNLVEEIIRECNIYTEIVKSKKFSFLQQHSLCTKCEQKLGVIDRLLMRSRHTHCASIT